MLFRLWGPRKSNTASSVVLKHIANHFGIQCPGRVTMSSCAGVFKSSRAGLSAWTCAALKTGRMISQLFFVSSPISPRRQPTGFDKGYRGFFPKISTSEILAMASAPGSVMIIFTDLAFTGSKSTSVTSLVLPFTSSMVVHASP